MSYELYNSGKTVAEIASTRGFAESTIYGHLASFVGNGMLKIEQFLPQDKITFLEKFYTENPEIQMGEAKLKLGDEYSFMDLKFFISHLKRMEKKEE